jgi:hypothetical protein
MTRGRFSIAFACRAIALVIATLLAITARPAFADILVALGPPQPDTLSSPDKVSAATLAAGTIAAPGFRIIRVDDSPTPADARARAVQSRADFLVIVTQDADKKQLIYDSYRPSPNTRIGHIVRAYSDALDPLTPTEQSTLFPGGHRRTLLVAPETGTDNGLADKDFINAYIGALLDEKNTASYSATMEFNQFQTPTLAQQSQQGQISKVQALQAAQLSELRQQSRLMLSLSSYMLSLQNLTVATSAKPKNTQAVQAMSLVNSSLKQLEQDIAAIKTDVPTITFPATDIGAYATELCRIYNADGIFVWHVTRANYTHKLIGQYSTDVAMKGQEFNCNAEQVWSAKGIGQRSGFTGLGSALVSTFNLLVAFKPKVETMNSQTAKPLIPPYLDLPEAIDKSHFDYEALRKALENLVSQHP